MLRKILVVKFLSDDDALMRHTGGDDIKMGFKTRDVRAPNEFK
jgi:hypothetical protein